MPQGRVAGFFATERGRLALRDAIRALSASDQDVLIATEPEGRKCRELSLEWGIPINTLLSRKARAIKRATRASSASRRTTDRRRSTRISSGCAPRARKRGVDCVRPPHSIGATSTHAGREPTTCGLRTFTGGSMRHLAPVLLAVFSSVTAIAQTAPPPRAEILILGTYHMANPGRDIFNMKADDVLSAKRQAEIGELLEVLKRFKPTKIAIESAVYEDRAQQHYAEYLVGTYALSRNEDDQIGYRLAKELGMKAIYPVDIEGEFPMQRVVNYAKATGQSPVIDQVMSEIGEMVKRQDAYLHAHTVLETLLYMNDDRKVAQDVGFYYREARLGDAGDYAGPDLLASWYQRNIRIYCNIAKVVESPDERVLVIYGAGHLGWLRQDVANDPSMRLRKLEEFVGPGTS
jgi:hypothetical protein